MNFEFFVRENIFSIFAISLATLASGSVIIYTLLNGASPMPTAPGVKKIILSILNRIKGKKVVYELGSGWGTLAAPIAREMPESTIYAIENSPLPYFFSIAAQTIFKRKNLLYKHTNFFNISLRQADVIITYLHPDGMKRLKEKFKNELKPGTIIICNTFAVPGWKPEKVYRAADLYNSKIYVYSMHGPDGIAARGE